MMGILKTIHQSQFDEDKIDGTRLIVPDGN
jgi:hypothetical protein